MKREQQKDFEQHLRKHLTELFGYRLEYEEAQTDLKVNPDGLNTDYFRGKAEAYRFAHRQLLDILKWFDIKV